MLRRAGPPIISFTVSLCLSACVILLIEQLTLKVLTFEVWSLNVKMDLIPTFAEQPVWFSGSRYFGIKYSGIIESIGA